IDDARIRQNELDEPEMPEVVRHLVDEERLAAAIYARVGQVLGAEPARLLGSQTGKGRGVVEVRIMRLAALRALQQARNVGQLHRSLDLGVRCQNLLEQSRTGARQAHDEDRLAAWVAPAAAGCKERVCAGRALQPGIALGDFRTVTQLRLLQ